MKGPILLTRNSTAPLFFAFLFSLFSVSSAAEVETHNSLLNKGEEHLKAWRVSQAEEVVAKLIREHPKSPLALGLMARVAFYQGRYQEAFNTSEKSLAILSNNEQLHALRLLSQQTRDTVKKLMRFESAHFILYLNEKTDRILVPHVLDTMEKTYEVIGNELGFFPQAKVRIEIVPDVSSFNAISTLSLRDIEETGAVGICKFNKIITISPRVLQHGYRWLDSLSHEYLHFAIVGLSSNKAPIWLHEGMARFYETRWRHPKASQEKPDYLSPANETLLARALEADQFIGFKNMEPSLVSLETPEEVQLAYAEAASAIDFISHRKGKDGLNELLSGVAQMPTSEAIEEVLETSFEEFETQWKEFLQEKGLQEIEGSRVRKLKVKKDQNDGGDTVELKEIQSAVARNRSHLANLLWARGRRVAAAAEYRRALKASPHSIIILNRLGRVLSERKKYEEALPYLKKAKDLDPDYVSTQIQLGSLYHATKDYSSAITALEESIQINPFDPTIYHLLYQIHTARGETDRAKNAKSVLEMLMRRR
jgi:tetratricopeptide (TPR) repeat protein